MLLLSFEIPSGANEHRPGNDCHGQKRCRAILHWQRLAARKGHDLPGMSGDDTNEPSHPHENEHGEEARNPFELLPNQRRENKHEHHPDEKPHPSATSYHVHRSQIHGSAQVDESIDEIRESGLMIPLGTCGHLFWDVCML